MICTFGCKVTCKTRYLSLRYACSIFSRNKVQKNFINHCNSHIIYSMYIWLALYDTIIIEGGDNVIKNNKSKLIIIFNQSNIKSIPKRIEYDCEHILGVIDYFDKKGNIVAICDGVDYSTLRSMCGDVVNEFLTCTDLEFLDHIKYSDIFDNKVVIASGIYGLYDRFEDFKDTFLNSEKLIVIIGVHNMTVSMHYLVFLESLIKQFTTSIYLTNNAKDYIEINDLSFAHETYYRIKSSIIDGQYFEDIIEPKS